MKPFPLVPLGMLLLSPVAGLAEEEPSQAQQQLENVREQIRHVEQDVADTQSKTAKLREELQANELAATETLRKLEAMRGQVETQETRIARLQQRQTLYEGDLRNADQRLKTQIRSAVMLQHHKFLLLLLRQEEPAPDQPHAGLARLPSARAHETDGDAGETAARADRHTGTAGAGFRRIAGAARPAGGETGELPPVP